MVRGRTTGRGGRRGAAAAGSRPQPESTDATADANQASTQPDASAGPAPASSSAAGASTQSPAMAPARRGATAQASRGASIGRFRPKNVRRDEAERDSLARQEEQKANERVAAERRARGRSRFRSKRSRGDTMGSRGGGFGRTVTGASGPFSSGMGQSAGISRSSGWGGGGSGFGSGGPSSFGSRGPGGKSKGGPGFKMAGDGYPREARINADKLNAMTPDDEMDSEDEAMMTVLQSRATSIFPMGIYRREHKEADVVVATTAELEAAENATGEEESLWVDGQNPSSLPPDDQPEEEQGIWESSSKQPVVVKKEPGTEDLMDLDVGIKPPVDDEDDKKAAVAAKIKKVLPQDPEDKMIQSDLKLLANELGAVTITEDGETRTEAPANKDGRMYLFQFPPILPPLKETSAPSKVKQEPDDTVMLDESAGASDPTPVDLTQEGESRIPEGDADEDPDDRTGFMSSLLSQGGMVGKLNVRKSGKVELEWGGRILDMSPATGMNFLTTAVLVEENDTKPQNGVLGGDSIGMGKIMGRFVVAPGWDEEEEWNVAPEELNAG